jgi:glycosyltransferase involved in cell wall biosynthesis
LIHGEGIDESEFRFTSREEANIKFLLASRLVKSKGIEVFVSVAKDLKKSYPHIEFCLAGIFDSANPESISKELFQEISESDHINFLGEVPHHQMEDCFHKHSVFVLTSEREGLPKAAAEAASTGMPLILSDVPGCRDCVKDNGSGMLVTYNNSHELYQAMELFINESNLIASMGKKSAIHAKEKFSLEVITQQYLKILQEN